MENSFLYALKAFAAFAVVYIHYGWPAPVGTPIKALAEFAVPIFFMISGYYVFDKDNAGVKKSIKKTFLLFLAANIVYFVFNLFTSLIGAGEGVTANVSRLTDLKKWWELLAFNKPMFPYTIHLWYLSALLYCYIFIFLINKTRLRKFIYILIPVLPFVSLIAGNFMTDLGITNQAVLREDWIVEGMPFFLLGDLIHKYQVAILEKAKKMPAILVLIMIFGAALKLLEIYVFSIPFELCVGIYILVIPLFILALLYPEKFSGSVMANIGKKYSSYIYLWHMMLLAIISGVAKKIGILEHIIFGYSRPILALPLSFVVAYIYYGSKKNFRLLFLQKKQK